jgi:hypothetical protein
MLATALIIVAAIVVVFLVVVALQPADFRIQRTALIAAPAQVVFAQVNDFRKWLAWSPWEKLDLALKRTYEGDMYAWAGNKKVGEGRMTITESRPGELVKIKLEFFKPFAATNTAEFTFKPEGGGTAVTWSMIGRNNFMAKALSIFMSMEKMVGGQFEQGLAQMKSVVETKR